MHETPASRSVTTLAVSRLEVAAVGIVVALVVGAFLQLTAGAFHGVGTAILLGAAAVALAYAGGSTRTARRVTADDSTLTIDRYNHVRTRLDRAELAGLRVVAAPAALLLMPVDRDAFFLRHRELQDSATDEGALVPLGRRRGVADEVAHLLAVSVRG